MPLTKSDFKIARTCSTKLYYRKLGFPTVADDNEYMQMLAEGGYMVGKLAQLKYPYGIEIDSTKGNDYAVSETRKLLQENKNITLFEAAIEANGKLVKIDILEKTGKRFNIIEVKSKSWDSESPPKYKDMQEYVEDLLYQTFVLQEAYRDSKISSFLYMPDKAKNTKIDGLNGLFSLQTQTTESGKTVYEVEFNGNEENIQDDDIMTLVDYTAKINEVMPDYLPVIDEYLDSLKSTPPVRITTEINYTCRDCEYRTDNGGFDLCWGKLAKKSTILEMAYLGSFNRGKGEINTLIAQGKVKLSDVPQTLIEGKYNNRAFLQINQKTEWLSDEFQDTINKVEYPIHFIDFEASIMALPYHAGMRPYEKVAFQWSCHTLSSPDAPLTHSEWINVNNDFPNFEFAEKLMEQIGDTGTVMMWSPYENTTLREIYEQMGKYGYKNTKLRKWLEGIIKFEKDAESRLMDMNKLALKNYFHPLMGGRTSIKVTLPAVLAASGSTKIKSWLEGFEANLSLYGLDKGHIMNPYNLLPALDIVENGDKVKDGTGAMKAYQEMMFGLSRTDSDIKDTWKQALLRYCKLDTLAMVIIWEHWQELVKARFLNY